MCELTLKEIQEAEADLDWCMDILHTPGDQSDDYDHNDLYLEIPEYINDWEAHCILLKLTHIMYREETQALIDMTAFFHIGKRLWTKVWPEESWKLKLFKIFLDINNLILVDDKVERKMGG